MAPGCLALFLVLMALILWPFLLASLFTSAFQQLGFSPLGALFLLLAVLLGGGINLPVYEVERSRPVPVDPVGLFGLGPFFLRRRRVRERTVVAVNVGGCLIPAFVALYALIDLLQRGGFGAVVVAVLVNVVVCHSVARPVPGRGVVLPAFISPLVSVAMAWLLHPVEPVSVAFIAGVLGPLVGADLLNLRQVENMASGLVSIGGAGTFDAIVLSGVFAAVLAG